MRYNRNNGKKQFDWDGAKNGDRVTFGQTPCLILRRPQTGAYRAPMAFNVSINNARWLLEESNQKLLRDFVNDNETKAPTSDNVRQRALQLAEEHPDWTWQAAVDAARVSILGDQQKERVEQEKQEQQPAVTSVSNGSLRAVLERMKR